MTGTTKDTLEAIVIQDLKLLATEAKTICKNQLELKKLFGSFNSIKITIGIFYSIFVVSKDVKML